MRLINTSELKAGDRLIYPIKGQDGRVLLSANSELTQRFIERLQTYGISFVYISDTLFDEVEFTPSVSDQTKLLALKVVEDCYKRKDSKKLIDTSAVKSVSQKITSEVRTAMLSEPVGLTNMYVVPDQRLLHALNVATITCALATELNLNYGVIEDYTTAALLHDLYILDMKDDSNFEHQNQIKDYLKMMKEYSVRTYMAAGMHHERVDGQGPGGYSGDKISEGAKILAIADIFDSLIYGYGGYQQSGVNIAIERLQAFADKVIDLEMLKVFNSSVAVYPTGSTVQLNNGLKAVIVKQNHKMPSRPVVRLLMPKKEDCMEINLMTSLTVFVNKIL